MTFNEWWSTKDVEKVDIPNALKNALKDLAYEAWCESRNQQSPMKKSNEKIYVCPYCELEYTKPEGAKTCCKGSSPF